MAIVSLEKEIADLAEHCTDYELIGVFETNPHAELGRLTALGDDADWADVRAMHPGLKIALAVDPPKLKKRLVQHYGLSALATLVSPDAYVASSARLGIGCLVQLGSKVMPDASLGTACKVNINTTVHHDTRVGDYCTLAPGCQLLGSVVIEDECFIGAGAIVLPHVRVGREVTIGAGAVVTSDVEAGRTVIGIPARALNVVKS